MNENEMINEAPVDAANYLQRAIGVISRPTGYFKTMPRGGGLADPLLFVVVIALIDMVLSTAKVMVTAHAASLGAIALLGGMVLAPIFAVVGSFIGAGIVFVIWRVLGSQENYETAYRCTAAIYAISPLTVLIGFIPYGGLAGVAWSLYLTVIASVEVHRIAAAKAWAVLGVLAALVAFSYLGVQRAARQASAAMGDYAQQMKHFDADAFQKQLDALPKQAQQQ